MSINTARCFHTQTNVYKDIRVSVPSVLFHNDLELTGNDDPKTMAHFRVDALRGFGSRRTFKRAQVCSLQNTQY